MKMLNAFSVPTLDSATLQHPMCENWRLQIVDLSNEIRTLMNNKEVCHDHSCLHNDPYFYSCDQKALTKMVL
jgi:hypothetical protein